MWYQYTKREKRKCENYTGICITNPFIRITENIIKNWTEGDYQGTEEQSRFTMEHSTIDHIFAVRQIHEKCNTKQQATGLIFFDPEKAYDSIPRKLLWQALEKENVNQSIINIMKNMYHNNKCKINI
jgi:hypothetical protein